jgi:hypothetical protein
LPIKPDVNLLEALNLQPVSPNNRSGNSNSSDSTSEDERVEAKRQKMDPDYEPSTVSESSLTATLSQNVSEAEEETLEETESDESWHPSGSTSPEIISSPEDD